MYYIHRNVDNGSLGKRYVSNQKNAVLAHSKSRNQNPMGMQGCQKAKSVSMYSTADTVWTIDFLLLWNYSSFFLAIGPDSWRRHKLTVYNFMRYGIMFLFVFKHSRTMWTKHYPTLTTNPPCTDNCGHFKYSLHRVLLVHMTLTSRLSTNNVTNYPSLLVHIVIECPLCVEKWIQTSRHLLRFWATIKFGFIF